MATATHFQFDTHQTPSYYVAPLQEEPTVAASDFLNANMKAFHIFFNTLGFHNHTAHAVATLWSLGATKKQLEASVENNKKPQRPINEIRVEVLDGMEDTDTYLKALSNPDNWHTFLAFFQKEIEKKGWQAVFNEYLFTESEKSLETLCRWYDGFMHPWIHTGFGIEFLQPAMIAEGLGMGCVTTTTSLRPYLLECHKRSQGGPYTSKSMFELIDEIHNDPEITHKSPKIYDIGTSFKVDPAKVDETVLEMINVTALMTAGGIDNQTHTHFKQNFIFLHFLNSTIFLKPMVAREGPTAFFKDDATRAKMLEWTCRVWLFYYAAYRKPELSVKLVEDYQPKQPGTWDELIGRAVDIWKDDGHLTKMIRAYANGEKLMGDFPSDPKLRFRGKDIWLKAAHMAIDGLDMVVVPAIIWAPEP